MNRREALIQVIECLHAEIAALKASDVVALEQATTAKLAAIELVAANDNVPAGDHELRQLAAEANRLNETARIYVNLMAANVRRRLQVLAGHDTGAYRAPGAAAFG